MQYIKQIFLFLLLTLCIDAMTEVYCTQSLVSDIKTVRAEIANKPLQEPIIALGSNERIQISFDQLSYETKNYNYRIVHCNANWTPSDLSEIEYIKGFSSGLIDDYQKSVNTTVLYTHYRLEIPNDNLQLNYSGNYAVLIYEDNNTEKILASACFSVFENIVEIEANVRSNTDIELNKRFQQVDFSIEHKNFPIQDPFSQLKIKVRQNNRRDNEATDLKPTYTSIYKQTYKNNRNLIFEGGNQYRIIDFSSIYTYGKGIERIGFDHTYHHVQLIPDDLRANEGYIASYDNHGKSIVNLQNSDDSDIEADYMWVHFSLPVEQPWFNGSLFLTGDIFQGNEIAQKNRIEYNAETRSYEKAVFLKQGGYQYLYILVPKGETKGSLLLTEGSYWQTVNQYQIFVYYCPYGERYDRLIGWKTIKNSD